MQTNFFYKFSEINSVTNRLRYAGRAIDPSTSEIHDPSKCSGIMVSEYVERARRIGELMKKYRELVEKDVKDLEQIQKVVKEMDQKAAKNTMKKR